MPRRRPIPAGLAPRPRHPNKTGKITEPEGKPRSFSDLFRAQFDQIEDISALIADIQNTTDRTACILLGALIERALEGLLLTKICFGIPIPKPLGAALFERDGALSSFKGNIDLALALQVVTTETGRDLNIIRRIRNVFAHSALVITFESPEISPEINRLRDGAAYADNIDFNHVSASRKHFVKSCFLVLNELASIINWLVEFHQYVREAIDAYDKPPPP